MNTRLPKARADDRYQGPPHPLALTPALYYNEGAADCREL
jgi:hypothetical protein